MLMVYHSIQVKLGYYDLRSSQKSCLPEKIVKLLKVTVHEKFKTRTDGRGLRNMGII